MRYVMIERFYLCLGYSNTKTIHEKVFSAFDISSRSPKIFIWQACFDWSTYEMVSTLD